MPGGFAAPSILFLNSWNRVEREYMQMAATRLRATGQFDTAAEPSAGGFAMSGVYRTAGFVPGQIQASSESLFSAIVGMVLSNQDHAQLGVCLDGEPIVLQGDPVIDGAMLLYLQCLARMQAKPDVHYWREIGTDLQLRAEYHLEKLAYYLEQLRLRFDPGIDYFVEPAWTHMARLADDPRALVIINPPSYAGAYERFYDTKGRLTWNQPEYEVWEAKRDLPRLIEESAAWKCVLLCLQMAPHGECPHPDPVYAHDKRRGINDYIWSNQADVVRNAIGDNVSRQRGVIDHQKLDNPVIPRDYEITAESKVTFRKVKAKESRYYKDLWIHRIDFGQASSELVIFVDGYIAGMVGFSHMPIPDPELDAKKVAEGNVKESEGSTLSMLYCIGPHHDLYRLGRLVKMLAITKPVLETAMNAWYVVTSRKVLTKNWTKHPEAKGQRGIMRLVNRKPHPQFGYELTYVADIVDRTPEHTFALWLRKEEAWQSSRRQPVS